MNSIRKEKAEYLANLTNVSEFIVINNELSGRIDEICYTKPIDRQMSLDKLKKKYLSIMNTPVAYNAVIISIYGCFEAYIDRIAGLLLDFWIENASSYKQISLPIRSKHIQKCGDFLSNPQRYQNMDITEQKVINNLNLCLVDQRGYVLNKELIISHSGNLNSIQLMQFLSELGIKDCRSRILNSDQFIEYISGKYEVSNEDARQLIRARNNDDKFLFKELTQLVEQRNKVAHGWSVDERLSKEYLVHNVIPFMKMLGDALAELFLNESVKIMYLTGSLKKFDDAINVYNNRILCINCKDANLKCDQYIFANNGKRYIALNIKEIQVNSQSVEEVLGGNIDIGILVDHDIKKNWKYYYT